MLRTLVAIALILAASAAAWPARAQLATYCGGVIQAESFPRDVTPGVRATYSVTLRNAGGQARTFVLVVTAPFTNRPLPTPRNLAPGGRVTVGLGTQLLAAQSPLRDNELAELVRITCG